MKRIRLPILRMAAIGGFLWSGSVHAGITVEDVNSDGKVFVATVTDLANVDFITPNPSQFYVSTREAASRTSAQRYTRQYHCQKASPTR
jgi:hypothetical protein